MLRPVGGSLQCVLEPPVGPLDHAVTLGVVGRGGVVVRADDVAEAAPQRRGELGPLVGCEVGWDAEAGYPLADEGIPAGLCLDVGQRNCLQHPAGPVDDGEQVLEPLLGDVAHVHQEFHLLVPHSGPGLLVGGQLEGPRGSPGWLLLAGGSGWQIPVVYSKILLTQYFF